MSKKPVIIFEGIEGSGKTLHSNFVSKYLKKKNISFIKIREPGGSKNSEKIRKLILDDNLNFNKNTDLLLYLAARSENIDLLKKYKDKKLILIDTYKGAINKIKNIPNFPASSPIVVNSIPYLMLRNGDILKIE